MDSEKQSVEATPGVASVKGVTNERVIETLLALWTGVPYMRFGQLVMNVSRIEGGFADTWEWSNATWVKRMEDGMRTWAAFTPTTSPKSSPSGPDRPAAGGGAHE